ncbi:MAG: hypothetical protein K9L17_10595 [Clostridiales bacterium]|nr:hypothetical protein [Clostridiales bacterium]MCF8023128.1 hypothetical protein [Clostridiales bacterium]
MILKDYLEEIYVWEDGIPFDEFGYVLSPFNLYDGTYKQTTDKDKARYAEDITDPYGKKKFVIGSEYEYVCFDYYKLSKNNIVLHSVINSEKAGFIDELSYAVVSDQRASEVALEMIKSALSWIEDNNVEYSPDYWDQDPYFFYEEVCKACGIQK